MPSSTGIRMSISTTSGSRSADDGDRLAAVAGLPDHLAPARLEDQLQAGPDQVLVVGDHDPGHELRSERDDGDQPVVVALGPVLEGAAEQPDPFRDPLQPETEPRACRRRRPRGCRTRSAARRRARGPRGRPPRAVPERVGERLLRHPVDRDVDAARQRRRPAGRGRPRRRARPRPRTSAAPVRRPGREPAPAPARRPRHGSCAAAGRSRPAPAARSRPPSPASRWRAPGRSHAGPGPRRSAPPSRSPSGRSRRAAPARSGPARRGPPGPGAARTAAPRARSAPRAAARPCRTRTAGPAATSRTARPRRRVVALVGEHVGEDQHRHQHGQAQHSRRWPGSQRASDQATRTSTKTGLARSLSPGPAHGIAERHHAGGDQPAAATGAAHQATQEASIKGSATGQPSGRA